MQGFTFSEFYDELYHGGDIEILYNDKYYILTSAYLERDKNGAENEEIRYSRII